MNQSVEVAGWLGIGGLALIWGNLHLWQTRRALKRLRQEVTMNASRIAPTTVGEPVSSGISP